jgi:hypothetical protein
MCLSPTKGVAHGQQDRLSVIGSPPPGCEDGYGVSAKPDAPGHAADQIKVMRALGHQVLRDRLKMFVAARDGMIQARDVDPREPRPDGRHRAQDQALSD